MGIKPSGLEMLYSFSISDSVGVTLPTQLNDISTTEVIENVVRVMNWLVDNLLSVTVGESSSSRCLHSMGKVRINVYYAVKREREEGKSNEKDRLFVV
jgi:hypothetical protein